MAIDEDPFARMAYNRYNPSRVRVLGRQMGADAASGRTIKPVADPRKVRGGRPMAETINNFSDNGRGPNSRGATNPNSTVDLGTVKNDYAQGGDGTVAREAAPAQRSVNIAGGLSRDDIIRRMEMASTGMRGSPSARAAMMGAYADQLKSLDQGELDKNKGNIESDQLAYRGNMDANMQESRGRQDFGNNMGILNRKAELDAEAAAAAANDPYRMAQLENLTSQTELNRAKAINEATTRTITDEAADQRTYLDMQKAAREKLGPNATPEEIAAEVNSNTAKSGKYATNTTSGNIARADDAELLNKQLGSSDPYFKRLFLAGDQSKYVFGGQPTLDINDSANVDYYDASGESWEGQLRRFLGSPVYKAYNKTQGDPRENINAPSRILAPGVLYGGEDEKTLEALKRIKNASQRTGAVKPSQNITGY